MSKATPALPETGFVRLSTILAVFPISRSGWWAGVKAGTLPASVKFGGVTFWRAQDIHALIRDVDAGNAGLFESNVR